MFTLKSVVTLCVLCCLKATAATDILLPKSIQQSCLTKVLTEAMKDAKSLAITWPHRVDHAMKDDIMNLLKDKVKFILNNWRVEGQVNSKPGDVLILASKVKDILDGIASLNDTNSWSIESKFFVVYLDRMGNGSVQTTDPLLKEIFQTFANLNALNVRVIHKSNEDGIYEFTWFPYADSNCGRVNHVTHVSECEFGSKRIINRSNLESRCNIAVGVRSYEPYSFYSNETGFSGGVEIDLVKEFSHQLHFDVELKAIEGDQLNKSNFDIIVSASNEFTAETMRSIDFYFDDLTWCVKKAGLVEQWQRFFLFATRQVWTIATVGTYTAGASLYLFYGHYHHKENYHYCTGVVFCCIFGTPLPYNPTHGLARIHFGILLIYGLLLTTFINCYLTSIMTKRQYQYQVSTVEDLMYYEYKILLDQEVVPLHHLDLGDDEISAYTKANNEHCKTMVHCLSQLFERSKVVAIVPLKFAKHFESTTKQPLFCFAIPETFNKVTRSLTFTRSNSYLLNKMNRFVRQSLETGHLLKWEAACGGHETHTSDWSGPVVLTIEHLSGGFVLYAFWVTIAVMCFIGETMAFRNIARGNSRGWFWLDKLIFSPERSFG